MTRISTGLTDAKSSRRIRAKCVAVAFCLVASFVSCASLSFAETPKRNRVVPYEPVGSGAAIAETQRPETSRRNRTVVYEPVAQRSLTTGHTAARPIDGTQPSTVAVTLGLGSDRLSQRGLTDLIDAPLPEPGGNITDMELRRQLDRINQMSEAAKNGETLPPETNADASPSTSGEYDGIVFPANPSSLIAVKQIFQLQEGSAWYAIRDGSKTPIPLVKHGEKYHIVDENGNVQSEVFVPLEETGSVNVGENRGKTPSDPNTDKTRNAVLLIVTTVALLAALSVGFLAFDYKHRWEQEVVNQNNRLLGNDVPGGTFSSLDAFEPETFSFSSGDYGSLDPSFDSNSNHSFRTIA